MKGLELSERYFEECGLPMLQRDFPDVLPYLAAGLAGGGSECLGFDDEVSQDHDFEPGFCIFLPGEDIVDRRTAFLLERAYAKLPRQFRGFERSLIQPVGGSRHGVIRTADFFTEHAGTPDGTLSLTDWLALPEQSLTEATGGKLFLDNYGEVTRIRQRLMSRPEDVRRKKLAGHLLLMAQSGQYNYMRCLKHRETAAAQMAIYEFVKHAISAIFLLNNVYEPYYKWSFRALRLLPRLSIEAEVMEYLLTSDNEQETRDEKYNVIEGIASDIIDELMTQSLTEAICMDLEKHAYSVNDGITDGELRNRHILSAV